MRCNRSDVDIHLDFENYIFSFWFRITFKNVKNYFEGIISIVFAAHASKITSNETVFDALMSISRLHNNIALAPNHIISLTIRTPQLVFTLWMNKVYDGISFYFHHTVDGAAIDASEHTDISVCHAVCVYRHDDDLCARQLSNAAIHCSTANEIRNTQV